MWRGLGGGWFNKKKTNGQTEADRGTLSRSAWIISAVSRDIRCSSCHLWAHTTWQVRACVRAPVCVPKGLDRACVHVWVWVYGELACQSMHIRTECAHRGLPGTGVPWEQEFVHVCVVLAKLGLYCMAVAQMECVFNQSLQTASPKAPWAALQ